MTKPLSMTYHESYGELPTSLLRLYRRFNVSPSDHDLLLMRFGSSWSQVNGVIGNTVFDWQPVIDFVKAQSESGSYRPPLYL